ncbi:hypothetical protein Ancab_008412, partial [Ancistrocladus abbreviatus]
MTINGVVLEPQGNEQSAERSITAGTAKRLDYPTKMAEISAHISGKQKEGGCDRVSGLGLNDIAKQVWDGRIRDGSCDD